VLLAFLLGLSLCRGLTLLQMGGARRKPSACIPTVCVWGCCWRQPCSPPALSRWPAPSVFSVFSPLMALDR
jgi:hypothetical protein